MKHYGPISGIAAYQDHYIATAGYDNQVILWDGQTKTPIHRVHHDHLANQADFSPDGRFLASASSDYSARLWEIPSMRLVAIFHGHTDDVEMTAFSPDNRKVATCSRDTTIKVFDLSGRLLQDLRGHQADVISVSWTSDSRQLISSSDDGTVRRWDADTGAELECISFDGVETDTIALAADGTVFAGNDEGSISVIRDGRIDTLQAHKAGIKRLVYSPRQNTLVSLSYDRSAIIWSRDAQGCLRPRRTTKLPAIVWPRSCAFFGDRQLVFATFGSTYASYDFINDTWSLEGIEESISLNAVAYTPKGLYTVGDAGVVRRNDQRLAAMGSLCNFLLPFGRLVLTGGQMGKVYNAETGEVIYQHHSPLNCGATFDVDGRLHCVIGTYTGEGLVFRLDDNKRIQHLVNIPMHDNAIKGVCAGGGMLFSVCATGAAALHGTRDFYLIRYLPEAHDKIANGCASMGDQGFASISRDLKLRLWQGESVEVITTPHDHSIKCVAASTDGRYVATGGYAGAVAIYDRSLQQWCVVTRPTAAGLSSLTAGPGPHSFTASSYDGRTYIVAAGGTLRAVA